VQHGALEALAAAPLGREGDVLVAGRHHQLWGAELIGRRPHDPVTVVAVDAADASAEPHLDRVFRGVALEVLEELVSGREHRRALREAPVRQM
jgi:hypothetical protein